MEKFVIGGILIMASLITFVMVAAIAARPRTKELKQDDANEGSYLPAFPDTVPNVPGDSTPLERDYLTHGIYHPNHDLSPIK